jgi:nucleotide-binding universal stress UspA family protein
MKEGVKLNVKITPGHEVETIIKYAKQEKFDLLIIGFMGHSKIFGTVMGSTANTIVRLSPCDVLVVR